MVAVHDREQRILESRRKICAPFELDETLCLYSPQDNVDALRHKRIADWIRFITSRYSPRLPRASKRILLLMPCTKTKPYPFSTEHKRINRRLHEIGFRPSGHNRLPASIVSRLEQEYPPEVLDLSPLRKADTVIHRVVISEPLAFVPYEHIATYEGRPSPASAYDDPGLFENRGNAVSPWRPDSTASPISSTRWKWGDSEKRAYVQMHNAMAETLAKAIQNAGRAYTHRIAWVAPGLTHRSFVLAQADRAAHKVAAHRKVNGELLDLVGANDLLPEQFQITCLPTLDQCQKAIGLLAKRLRKPRSRVGGYYSRGGGDATPLALPELLDVLADTIKRIASDKSPRA